MALHDNLWRRVRAGGVEKCGGFTKILGSEGERVAVEGVAAAAAVVVLDHEMAREVMIVFCYLLTYSGLVHGQ